MKIEGDLSGAIEVNAGALTEQAAWARYDEAQRILRDADMDLDPIADSAEPPVWDDRRQRWAFSWPHVAATFHEYGTDAHTIRAKEAEVLAFKWPDAPAEIREQFRETYPVVFFESTTVAGLPERRFVRGGRDVAKRVLERQ